MSRVSNLHVDSLGQVSLLPRTQSVRLRGWLSVNMREGVKRAKSRFTEPIRLKSPCKMKLRVTKLQVYASIARARGALLFCAPIQKNNPCRYRICSVCLSKTESHKRGSGGASPRQIPARWTQCLDKETLYLRYKHGKYHFLNRCTE